MHAFLHSCIVVSDMPLLHTLPITVLSDAPKLEKFDKHNQPWKKFSSKWSPNCHWFLWKEHHDNKVCLSLFSLLHSMLNEWPSKLVSRQHCQLLRILTSLCFLFIHLFASSSFCTWLMDYEQGSFGPNPNPSLCDNPRQCQYCERSVCNPAAAKYFVKQIWQV